MPDTRFTSTSPREVPVALMPVNDLTSEEVAKLPYHKHLLAIQKIADHELNTTQWAAQTTLKEQMIDIVDALTHPLNPNLRGDDERHTEIQLDWAMQIRQATELDWATCLKLAGIFYYG